jgi:hypothetical protein
MSRLVVADAGGDVADGWPLHVAGVASAGDL